MATTLEISESTAPLTPAFLPPATVPELAVVAWERIEAWTRYRWTSRAVVFTVEGLGEWQPPLIPFTASTTEIWTDGAWATVSLTASPLGGFDLPEVGPYRIAGTAGDGSTPPSAAVEACRRLAAYLTEVDGIKGGLVAEEEFPDVARFRYASASAAARAMQNSGAADLLRPWRRLGVS